MAARRIPGDWDVALAVAAGGAVGGTARWLVTAVVPPSARGFPWATFVENVLGAFAIGLLLVLLLEVWRPGRYLRPFLGVGVLGGFTTFSAFANDTRALLRDGDGLVAGAYVAATLAAGLLAVELGTAAGRAVARSRGAAAGGGA